MLLGSCNGQLEASRDGYLLAGDARYLRERDHVAAVYAEEALLTELYLIIVQLAAYLMAAGESVHDEVLILCLDKDYLRKAHSAFAVTVFQPQRLLIALLLQNVVEHLVDALLSRRLCEVAQCIHLIALECVFDMACQEDYINVLAELPQLSGEGYTVQSRHFDIEEDDIVLHAPEALQELNSVRKLVHRDIKTAVKSLYYRGKITDEPLFIVAYCYPHFYSSLKATKAAPLMQCSQVLIVLLCFYCIEQLLEVALIALISADNQQDHFIIGDVKLIDLIVFNTCYILTAAFDRAAFQCDI